MQFTTVFVAALAAITASAAPIGAAEGADLAPRATSWALNNFSRRCDGGSCTFSYSIFDGQGSRDCYYKSAGPQASYDITCGKYKVTSAWSGQFGANAGFTTMSVSKDGKIIYPSYSDAELADGKTVKPDQSYIPAVI